jgi:hypothetical protein
VELAIALDLALETVEEIAFKLRDLAAAQARHVDVIALRATLVKVFLALHVHEVEFVNQAMTLEQVEGAVYGHAVHFRINALRAAQDLARIEVLLGSLDYAENGASLTGHAQTAGHKFRLQASGSFGLR